MIHINGLEDAEELCHEIHRTSYDMKKAFDSVSKQFMLLAWCRLGVALDVAMWQVSMNINGTTVVRTPHSLYVTPSVRPKRNHQDIQQRQMTVLSYTPLMRYEAQVKEMLRHRHVG